MGGRGTPSGEGPAPASTVSGREAELYRILAHTMTDHAVVLLDPDGRIRSWTAAAEQLHGYTAAEMVGRHHRALYPEDARGAGEPGNDLRAAAGDGRFESDGWRVHRDGSRFRARVVTTALHDGNELVGFGQVITDRTREHENRQRLARRDRQLEEAQEIAGLGSWEYDAERGTVTWSPELYRIFGFDPDEPLDYDRYLGLLLSDDRELVREKVRRALSTGEPYSHEHQIVRPDGELRWIHSRGRLIEDPGEGPRLVGTSLDITELKRAEAQARELSAEQAARAAAERTAQRMSFLAEASTLLDALLEYEETLRAVAWLAVPSFADWCAVNMLDAAGRLERLAVAHMDPEQLELAKSFDDDFDDQSRMERQLQRVARTGEPVLIGDTATELENADHYSLRDREAVRRFGLRSVIIVPIQVRDRILGTLTFASADSERVYTREDLLVAHELGARAALAIENVQLHSAEQEARARAEEAGERTARLQTVTARLSGAVTPEAVAEAVIEQGAAALEAGSGSLFLLRPDRCVELVRSIGLPDEAIADFSSIPVDRKTPVTDAIRTGQAVVMESLEQRRGRYPELDEVQPTTGTRSTVAVPLLSGSAAVGALAFGYQEDRSFTRADMDFVTALASQCVQALERAWLYETEHVARRAAEDASRAKSRFVATMSHELRTPLAAIIGYQELLTDEIAGPLTERQHQHLERIRIAARHLRDMVNQVLTISSLEAGEEEPIISSVELGTLVRETTEMLRPEADRKGLRLHVRVPDSPLALETDAGKVRQILLNLLANAVKFTGDGQIDVVVEAAPGGGGEVHVRDTGSGVAPADRERIFELFTQADDSMTREVGGTGLGLSVSRRLAHLLGGELVLQESDGAGATFRLSLPERPPSGQPSRST